MVSLAIASNADWVLDSTNEFASCTATGVEWNTSFIQLSGSNLTGTLFCENVTNQIYHNWTISYDNQEWTPSEITTLGWWDASNTSTITGSPTVTSLADISGNGQTLTGMGNPQTGAETINGLNVISMDGDDYLEDTTFTQNSGNISFVALARIDTVDATADAIYSMDGNTNDFQFDAKYTGTPYFRGQITKVGDNLVVPDTGGYNTTPMIYEYINDISTPQQYVLIDGDIKVNQSQSYPLDATTTEFYIFTNRAFNEMPVGAFAEMVVWEGDVTNATRQKVEGYLAHKWNTTSGLPVGHPYKTAKPYLATLNATSTLGYNISNGENYTTLGDSTTSSMNITFNFFRDNANIVYPRLYWSNITTTAVDLVTYTTLKHIDIEIFDAGGVSLDSSDYVQLAQIDFNTTIAQNVTIKMSGNVKKINLPQSTTLSLKLNDSVTLFDQSMVTVGGLDERKVFTIPITTYSAQTGQNTLYLWGKEDGSGAINITNLEFHVDFSRSTDENPVMQNVEGFTQNVTSASFTNLGNITTYRNFNTSSYLSDITIKYTNFGGTTATPSCILQYQGFNVSPEVLRTVDSGATGSGGMNLIENQTLPQNFTTEVWCKSDGTNEIQVDYTQHNIEMADNAGNIIFSGGNFSGTKSIGSGWNEINTVTGSTQIGTESSFLWYVNLQSTSGTQDGTDSPIFKFNSSTLPEVNCSLTYERDLSSDYAVIKGYSHCDGFTPGIEANVSLWVFLQPTETATTVSSAISGHESTSVATTEGFLPPIVSITYPLENATVSGFDQINWTVFDPNLDLNFCNVTLIDGTVQDLGNPATSPLSVNYNNYVPGDYVIKVSCIDDTNLVGTDNVSITITLATGGGLTTDEAAQLANINSCMINGTLTNGTTCKINQEVKSVGSPLAIVVFMLSIISALYLLPFKVERFSEYPVTDFVLKRCSWILATFLVVMTSGMVATIAEFAGINLTNEIFRVMWLFGWAGYIMIMWLAWGTLTGTLQLWKEQSENKRMGDD